jgi:hypothetical protein
MSSVIWMVFATATMIAMFAGCVIVVAAGTRFLEDWLATRRAKSPL